MTPDLSIVILNWNTRELLLQCIQSILEETRDHAFEIIVVDNASADGSPDAVREAYPDVRVIVNERNLGFAAGTNVGLREGTGRYSCIMNSDIRLLDGCLDRLIDYMDANPKVGSVGPRTTNEDGSVRYNCREIPSLRNALTDSWYLAKLFPRVGFLRGRLYPDFDTERTQHVEVLSGCLQVIRREALDQVGLLDERFFIYAEDTDWGRRFNEGGWPTMFCAEATAIHLGGASSSKAPIHFLLQRSHAGLQYWRKHESALACTALVAVMAVGHTIRWGVAVLSGLLSRGKSDRARYQAQVHRAQLAWYLFNRGRRPVLELELKS